MLGHILIILAGIVVGVIGHDEYKLRALASDEPVPVELSDLEAGQPLPDIHITLGHHWKVWDELIYSIRLEEGEEETRQTRVSYAFYPLVSEGHPHSQAFNHVPAGYASWAEVPPDEFPVLRDFAVLVRTTRFERVGDLPSSGQWTQADGLTGMVVNEIKSLDADERALLRSSYKGLDPHAVLIFEEGRKPRSMAYCMGMMAAGGGLVLLGLGLIVRSTTGRREGVGALPPKIKAAEVMK
ncbi:MAG: hypothetical protein QNK04_06290 [Myxococcota bacterium]|nr:hypothetical protein [Myxococcota bacterium]